MNVEKEFDNDYDVEYLDTSETPSEVDEMFEDARKEEALAASRLSLLEPLDDDE